MSFLNEGQESSLLPYIIFANYSPAFLFHNKVNVDLHHDFKKLKTLRLWVKQRWNSIELTKWVRQRYNPNVDFSGYQKKTYKIALVSWVILPLVYLKMLNHISSKNRIKLKNAAATWPKSPICILSGSSFFKSFPQTSPYLNKYTWVISTGRIQKVNRKSKLVRFKLSGYQITEKY